MKKRQKLITLMAGFGLLNGCVSFQSVEPLKHEGQVTFLLSSKSPTVLELPAAQNFSHIQFKVSEGSSLLNEITLDATPDTLTSIGRRFQFLPEKELLFSVTLLDAEKKEVSGASLLLNADSSEQVVAVRLKTDNESIAALEKLWGEINMKEQALTQIGESISSAINEIQLIRSTTSSQDETQIAALQDQLAQFQTQKSSLQKEKETLVIQLTSLEKSLVSQNTSQELDGLKLQKLKDQITEISAQREQLQNQADQLKSSTEPSESAVYNQLQQELLIIETQLTQLKLERAQLQQKLSSQGNDSVLSESERKELEARLSELNSEKLELEQSRLALIENQDDLSQARLQKIETSLIEVAQEILKLEKALAV